VAKVRARVGVSRWVFTALCTASLVLWVGMVVLWVRSYWRLDYWSVRRTSYSFTDDGTRVINGKSMRTFASESRRLCKVESAVGCVQVTWADQHFVMTPTMLPYVAADVPSTRGSRQLWSSPNARPLKPSGPTAFSLLGFAYISADQTIPTMGRTETRVIRGARVLLWLPTLLLAVLPMWWLRLARRKRKRPEGFCPSCGYDLRAHAAELSRMWRRC